MKRASILPILLLLQSLPSQSLATDQPPAPNEKVMREGVAIPKTQAERPRPDVEVHDRRDIVGMPLDDRNSEGGIGGDHILEMNDSIPADRKNPMAVDGAD